MESITVKELKALLEDWDDEARVVFGSNYGDRSGTVQAHRLRGRIEEVTLRESAYSDSGYAINEDGSDEDEIGGGADDVTYIRIK